MEALFDRFKQDHADPVSCQIKGSIPVWLKGTLFANGAGLFDIGKDRFRCLFDGMAVVQKYTFKSSNVSYCNRLIHSRTYKRNKRANRIVVMEFGTMANPDPLIPICTRYFWYYYDMLTTETDNTCVNVVEIQNELMAMTETNGINFVEPVSLATKRHVNLGNYVNLRVSSPHPKKDLDGYIWNFGTHISCVSHYTLYKMPSGVPDSFSNLKIVCEIPSRWRMEPSYFHSFGMTDNYVVFLEQTLTFPATLFLSLLGGTALAEILKFYKTEKCIFHVVDKRSGELLDVRFTADVFFSFHFANTFEDDGHLVVDLSCYPDASVLKSFARPSVGGGHVADSKGVSRLWRFVLPLHPTKNGTNNKEDLVTLDYTTAKAVWRVEEKSVFCVPEVFNNCILEMPQINHAFDGKQYRYCYGTSWDVKTASVDDSKLIKFDILKKKATIWADSNYVPSEPLFVPAPDAKEEDDGLILSPLFNKSSRQCPALLILNASTFTEIARAEIPSHVQVPYPFHGMFSNTVY